MIKCASVYTQEIDDIEAAIEEIKSQLDEKITLLEHTVGIIMCHPEFIFSGALKHICENLPFETAGVTTSSQAVNGVAGELILTIFVMTSDDAWFKTGVIDEYNISVDGSVKAAYEKASAGISEQPKLALIFPTISTGYSGDDYVGAWDNLIPGVPLYGTLAMDDTPNFEESKTICNGVGYQPAMSFVLCYGNINPRFLIGTVPEDNVMPYKGEITNSSGHIVREINDINTYKYFESIGFESNGKSAVNYLFLPFAISQKKREDYDGIPVIRVLSSFSEDGAALFHGDVDEGSTFALLKCEPDDVISTTKEKVRQINELSDVNGVLLFSCIVRRIVSMRENSLLELESVRDEINPGFPFMMGYAGGEICPTLIKGGTPTNRYHNYSLVILVI
ncbi:MAG: FIST C-terminal domain-containing protein [Synergistaceae bacterium]|nr:FIST C-terminal domain-containing protein [Synergistaceae bacterium]